jgi:hypothetical protein
MRCRRCGRRSLRRARCCSVAGMETEADVRVMRQEAPYPVVLEELISRLRYRPGWRLWLGDRDRGQGSKGLTFEVVGTYPDTYDPETLIRVRHMFIVPAAAYNEQSWRRWLLDCFRQIETHEMCEFFQVDGERPFAPRHGPGNDPYVIVEYADEVERRTNFRGEVQERVTAAEEG